MTSRGKTPLVEETAGEILIAWQHFTAGSSDELSLREGDLVELMDTVDPAAPLPKRAKMDPELDKVQAADLLDSAAAKHKLSVKPKRTHSSSRMSPSQLGMNRWLVRQVTGDQKQGWVPCGILQTVDEPTPDTGPGDAAYRRDIHPQSSLPFVVVVTPESNSSNTVVIVCAMFCAFVAYLYYLLCGL